MNSLSREQCKPARGELRRSFMAKPLLSRRRPDARRAPRGADNGLRSEDVQPVPLASDQALDLTLQPRNSTLATLSPVFKGLSLLEEIWRMAESDHLHTESRHLEEGQSRRTLRLNRGCRDFYLVNGSAAGGPDFSEAVYMG
jgi:hypothetical protein